ncbi:MAG: hypothetical protein M1836_002576 [Candelina mexicana]|nr:MAG: hypothetical protein M1836_002576 [Candelina mexicana]
MDWHPDMGFDGPGYGGFYGAMDGIQRPQFATNPQDILPYDDRTDFTNSWSNDGQESSRPLEERISAKPQDLNHLAYQQNYSLYGTSGTGERMGNHQVHVPVTIPGISMREPTPKTQSPGTFASIANQNSALNTAGGALSEQARLEKAADLRAKLKASLAMRSGGMTPGREADSKDKAEVHDAESALTPPKEPTVDDQPQVMTDIEGLFAEARAAAGEKNGGEPKEPKDAYKKSANHKAQEPVAKSSTKRPTVPEKNETVPFKTFAQGPSKEVKVRHKDSGEPSEASELGEIRETTILQVQPQAPIINDTKNDSHSRMHEKNVLPKAATSNKLKDSQRDKLTQEGLATAAKDYEISDSARIIRPRAIDTRSGADQVKNPKHAAQLEQHQGQRTEESGKSSGEIGSPLPPKQKARPSKAIHLAAGHGQTRAPRQTVIANDMDERRPADALPASSNLSPAELHHELDGQPRRETLGESSSYYDDLNDWLEMTGYHDQPYRKKALRRHKELIALEMQKAMLEREAQLEHEERVSFARAQSIIPHNGIEITPPQSTFGVGSIMTSSRISMPPPPLPVRADMEIRGQSKPIRSASANPSTTHSVADDEQNPHYPHTPPGTSLKRRSSISNGAYQERKPVKHARTESGDHTNYHSPNRLETQSLISPARAQNVRREDDERSQRGRPSRNNEDEDVEIRQRGRGPSGRASSPTARLDRERSRSLSPLRPRMSERYDRNDHRRLSEDDLRYVRHPHSPTRRVMSSRETSPSYGRSYELRAPPRSVSYGYSDRIDYKDDYVQRKHSDDSVGGSFHQPNDKYYHNPESGRGRGRGRGATYYSRGGARNNKFARQEHKGVESLDLRTGDTRFFLVKSWNHENVQTSQHDNIWCTQNKHIDIFSDAFHSCRDVILVFSVNKSTAFQGYARMESAPGAAKTPTWAKNLLWPSSPPFKIRWITIAETKFHRVGHLKNSLNEDQAVLVGRDGQEIEEKCGVALCELIDEEDARTREI